MSRYIIFGTGVMGERAFKTLGSDNIDLFCDNRYHDDDDLFMGKPVVNAGKILEYYDRKNHKVILAVIKLGYVIEISEQLYKSDIPFSLLEEEEKKIVRDEAEVYERMNPPGSFHYDKKFEYLFSGDRVEDAGAVSSYLWQDLWAAMHIMKDRPSDHYDIGSRIDGFITHLLSSGQHVVLIDIRPYGIKLPGLDFIQADATNLDGIKDESLMSLSALCSLEHFGLGRYGDPIDPMACFNCFNAIQRKMRSGGVLYLSLPIGYEHLEFNAHRVFYASSIIKSFSQMDLLEFSSCYKEQYEENIPVDKYDDFMEKGGDRFGLFRFIKR